MIPKLSGLIWSGLRWAEYFLTTIDVSGIIYAAQNTLWSIIAGETEVSVQSFQIFMILHADLQHLCRHPVIQAFDYTIGLRRSISMLRENFSKASAVKAGATIGQDIGDSERKGGFNNFKKIKGVI